MSVNLKHKVVVVVTNNNDKTHQAFGFVHVGTAVSFIEQQVTESNNPLGVISDAINDEDGTPVSSDMSIKLMDTAMYMDVYLGDEEDEDNV